MPVTRYDIGELARPEFTPEGWARVDGYLTRSGVFVYRNPDGTQRREYRPPGEVFKADSLSSFALVPVTNNHPPEGLLTAQNTGRYQVGTVEMPSRDSDKVRARMLITDAETIAAMKAGKTENSCGYICDMEEVSGVTESGERYDSVQRNIRGNHVALVSVGRAGKEVRVRMDRSDAVMLASTSSPDSADSEEIAMMKIKIDGIEFEVPESAGQAFAKVETAYQAKLDAAGKDLEKQTARADAAEAETAKLKKELAETPAKVRQDIAARVALETSARKVLGAEARLDTLSDLEVQKTVAEKHFGKKYDGKTEAYVAAMFDIAVEQASQPSAVDQARAGTAPASRNDSRADSVETAREKYLAAQRDAWKTPAK